MGPRTPIVSTMKGMFSIRISSTSGLGSDMIILDNVLKIRIELIKCQNDNVTEKFYLVQTIFKSLKFNRNFENFKKILKIRKLSREALLLYELSEREPG